MSQSAFTTLPMRRPAPGAVLELLKPVTWFAPVWAFGCGAVSAMVPGSDHSLLPLAVGLFLAGPLLCGASQAVNDWFDRDVDAINEPHRPIPSGRIPGRTGLAIAIVWSALSAAVAAFLGPVVFLASLAGIALSWAYSAPPVRLKRRGIAGPAAVAFSYEGLAWITGAALVAGVPSGRTVVLAILFSLASVGIMVLNDFKAVAGDIRFGNRTLPATIGVRRAAWSACHIMTVPQAVLAATLYVWAGLLPALIVLALLAGQMLLMRRYVLTDPVAGAARYNATGTLLFVLGMAVSALTLGPLS